MALAAIPINAGKAYVSPAENKKDKKAIAHLVSAVKHHLAERKTTIKPETMKELPKTLLQQKETSPLPSKLRKPWTG